MFAGTNVAEKERMHENCHMSRNCFGGILSCEAHVASHVHDDCAHVLPSLIDVGRVALPTWFSFSFCALPARAAALQHHGCACPPLAENAHVGVQIA